MVRTVLVWFCIGVTGAILGSLCILCYPINPGGKKKLKFMDATSGSNSSVSRMIEFEVPGNGIVNFGTGATVYEILSITETQVHLRSVGVTGLAWYMKLKAQ